MRYDVKAIEIVIQMILEATKQKAMVRSYLCLFMNYLDCINFLLEMIFQTKNKLIICQKSVCFNFSNLEYIEDICPYATFQLNKQTYSESSYSGNVYSGPYHSVRGSFVYHDAKPDGHVSL